MRTLLPILMFTLVGVARAETPEQAKIRALEATIAKLEARVKKLEQVNAGYAEALEFLQKVYVQQKAQQDAAAREEPDDQAVFAVDIRDNLKNRQLLGSARAGVTIVWAFDFADQYSYRMVPVIDDVVASYAGKVRVVFKNMVVHPATAMDAHRAGCAAGKQGKFIAFWRAFWTQGFEPYKQTYDATRLSASNIVRIASAAGLDGRRLEADMKSKACDALIKADMAELAKFRVNATPTFFINGRVSSGARPKEMLVAAIDEALAVVKASKTAPARYYEKEVMAKGVKKFRSRLDANK